MLRLGAQRVVQELLEHEVTDFLGREHYRRGPRRITGYRNGYKPKTLPTVAGRLPVQVPQVRVTAEPFQSRLLRFLADPAQQDVLQRLVTEMDCPRALHPGHRRRLQRRDGDAGADQIPGEPTDGDAVDRL